MNDKTFYMRVTRDDNKQARELLFGTAGMMLLAAGAVFFYGGILHGVGVMLAFLAFLALLQALKLMPKEVRVPVSEAEQKRRTEKLNDDLARAIGNLQQPMKMALTLPSYASASAWRVHRQPEIVRSYGDADWLHVDSAYLATTITATNASNERASEDIIVSVCTHRWDESERREFERRVLTSAEHALHKLTRDLCIVEPRPPQPLFP